MEMVMMMEMVMSMQSLWPWCRWPADPPLSCSTGVKRGEPAHPWLGEFWTRRSHRTFVCSKYFIREKIVLFGPGQNAWDETLRICFFLLLAPPPLGKHYKKHDLYTETEASAKTG